MEHEAQTVYTPHFQVKVAGIVVTNTNSHENAHNLLHFAGVRPRELWQIEPRGNAQLLAKVLA